MIKILHVIGAMDRGGAETMIMNFYREIDREKIHFDFLVHETRECDYDKEIRELGGSIYSVPRYKIYNYFFYKKAIKDFFYKHHDYDIIHGHICSCVNIYFKEAKRYGIKTIAHSHASDFGISLYTLFTKFVSFRTRYIADFFLGCSHQAGIDHYGERIVDSPRFSILNNGIKTELYKYNQNERERIRKKLEIDEKIVIGHVGRFTYAKNHKFIIDIFKEIQKMNKNTVLLLFGRGELERQIRELVIKNNLDRQVFFMGVVEDIYNYLNALDLFLFPSRFEGLGIALIEAQASGLPCVVNECLPQEAVLSNDVHEMSLDESAREWGEACLNFIGTTNRSDLNALVKEKGYDISSETRRLERIYHIMSEDGLKQQSV